jgi:hypothetical protein
MKSLPNGYVLRPDGFYERPCEFKNGKRVHTREKLIRTKGGVLVRVESIALTQSHRG